MKHAYFPKDFLWGASTASYQVEGGNHNQWSEWEQANADELAQTASKRLSWLPNWSSVKEAAEQPDNYISGDGVDHYHRYEEDFDLLQELNMNAFRFGIEWSRCEPWEGEWDEAAIGHYKAYVAALKARGIEPILTLWHWTMPTWFAAKGGFEQRSNLPYFERFAAKIADELAADLRYVLTVNEPNVYAGFSYVNGEWPPQRKSLWTGYRVYHNLAKAHRLAQAQFKRANQAIAVGVAQNLAETRPTHPHNPLNCLVAAAFRYVWGWWWLDRTHRQSDFIGINFYFTEYRDWLGRIKNPAEPVSELGWYMEPSGLTDLLDRTWRRYRLPLLIVENGLADSADRQRQWWLEETLTAIKHSWVAGVPLIGYLHWSLLDNFEWKYGWWPKFGLVAVNRENNMQRTIRPSARWLANKIKRL